jgi:hypothetical protein
MAQALLHTRARFRSARRGRSPACARALGNGGRACRSPGLLHVRLQLPGTSALSARSAAGPALASSSVRARARGGDIKRLSIAARRDARHAEARECRRRAHVSASDDGRTQRKPNSCDGVRMFPENVAQTRAEGRGREAHLGL